MEPAHTFLLLPFIHLQHREGYTLLIGLFPFNKDPKKVSKGKNDRLVNFVSQLQKRYIFLFVIH